jgi:hypothetical protein
MILMRALRGPLEGVGPEIETFLWPEMPTREASAIWNPKKSRFHEFHEFQGPPLPMALVMDSARIKAS